MNSVQAWTRRQQVLERRAKGFALKYAEAFRGQIPAPDNSAPRSLFFSGAPPRTETELCLMAAIAFAGSDPVPVIMMQPEILRTYYDLLAPRIPLAWTDFLRESTEFHGFARDLVNSTRTLEELIRFEKDGVRIGGHAVATLKRRAQIGTVDLKDRDIRERLISGIAESLAVEAAASRLLDRVSPAAVFAVDNVYTPKGEIFDATLARDIPFIRWFPAHKSNALMFKRYTRSNRSADLNSLSDESWDSIKRLPWDESWRTAVHEELRSAYLSGDWYSETATQFDRQWMDPESVRTEIGLPRDKRLAVIFAHIAWDASFGRGEDLFSTYDEWLAETVRAACANPNVQWLIKVHPAHAGKRKIDFWEGVPNEEALLKRFGRLPGHVRILDADTPLSTFSLFPVMDWAVTVRGTAGLEAACFGIPVITGGSGRYDRRGFTQDSDSRESYLSKLGSIHTIGRMSEGEVQLANRYAYGLFKMRPLPLKTITTEYHPKYGSEAFFNGVEIFNRTAADWQNAEDLNAFARWATGSRSEDFMMPAARD